MAIAHEQTLTPVGGTTTAGATISESHSINAGTDLCLVVIIFAEQSDNLDVQSVTWNGVALTKVVDQPAPAGGSSTSEVGQVWVLANPDTGSHTLTINLGDGGTGQDLGAMVLVYSGVDQANPVGATASNSVAEPNAAEFTIPITTTQANSYLVCGVSGEIAEMGPWTPATGLTERHDDIIAGLNVGIALCSADRAAASVAQYTVGATATGTSTDRDKNIVAIELLEPSSGDSVVQVHNESVSVQEGTVRTRQLTRTQSETVQLAEAVINALGIFRVQTETTQFSEAASTLLGLIRLADETLEIHEGDVSTASDIFRTTNESVELSEATLRALGLVRVESETLELSENTVQSLAALIVRVIDETLQTAEATELVAGLKRVIDETLSASEAIQRSRALTRFQDESVELGEATATVRALLRLLGETIEVGETRSIVRGLVRAVAESLNISEATVKSVVTQVLGYLVGTLKIVAALKGQVEIKPEE